MLQISFGLCIIFVAVSIHGTTANSLITTDKSIVNAPTEILLNERYTCLLCQEYLKYHEDCNSRLRHSQLGGASALACEKFKTLSVSGRSDGFPMHSLNNTIAWCSEKGLCDESLLDSPDLLADSSETRVPDTPDIRVSRVLGDLGYNKIRLSSIYRGAPPITKDHKRLFGYSKQFRHRWTQFSVATSVQTVHPGESTAFVVDGVPVVVQLPANNAPTRGLVIADPCVSSIFVKCDCGELYDTNTRLSEILNLLMPQSTGNNMDFFAILGDNFYDKYGNISKRFFETLSLETKSKFIMTVPGNHDFWVAGSIFGFSRDDQYGNGYMQFYAQDTVASHPVGIPSKGHFLDFSVNPDKNWIGSKVPNPANFVSFYKIGNIGFFGSSGAHEISHIQQHLVRACKYFARDPPGVIFVLGHWDHKGDGATESSTAPGVRKHMMDTPQCATVRNRIKYLTGHTHTNQIVEEHVGFLVGSQGMNDDDKKCTSFGLPVLETTSDNRVVLRYFEFADAQQDLDKYAMVRDCFAHHGVDGCNRFATVWLNESLPIVS